MNLCQISKHPWRKDELKTLPAHSVILLLSCSKLYSGTVKHLNYRRILNFAWLYLYVLGSIPVFSFGGPSPVTISRVELKSLRETREFSGTSLAWKKSSVGSPSEGIVKKRNIFYGVDVKESQILLEIDSSEQLARLDALKAEREALYQDFLEKKEGSRIEEIEVARSELKKFEAESREAKLQLKRIKGLLSQSATSRDLFDEAVRDEEVATAQVENARAGLKLLEAGEREQTILGAQARWSAAEARVDEMQKVVAKMRVQAPFSGTSGEVFVEVGDWIGKGDPIADLYDSSKIDVVVLVPERLIYRVRLLSKVACRFTALNEQEFSGLVASIGPATTQAGRTVPVIVRFQNSRNLVKPGMSVTVQLELGEEVSSLWVHKDSVLRGGENGPMVYIHEEGKVQPRDVKLGHMSGSQIEILTGLKQGEEVIIKGNERLRPGASVIVSEKAQAR
ncbi:efflux RND transporter periplasmic adaptor subunit [bacterium]|jgi:multidrug efflux pump subunit AcrA (membrane-fusion protein)|nr:efflux RND transporter periplasmic adaptor subunit [bacterium]